MTTSTQNFFDQLLIYVNLYQHAKNHAILYQKTLFLACFWFIFPNFGVQRFFPENQALSHTTSYGFLAPSQNSEKTNFTIPRKHQDRRTDSRTEGQTDPILYDPCGYHQRSKKSSFKAFLIYIWYIFIFYLNIVCKIFKSLFRDPFERS